MQHICVSSVLVIALLSGAVDAGRLLRQETYVTVKGQTPGGFYAKADKAEALAAGSSKGIRYNGGDVTMSGPMYPGSRSSATTGVNAARSGNTMAEANVNLGREVIAATEQGARAVAGSGVMHTAEVGASVSSNTVSFRPATVPNRGSVAFTDVAANSAAVNGMGNGPAAIAWGEEVAAMARSSRDKFPRNWNN